MNPDVWLLALNVRLASHICPILQALPHAWCVGGSASDRLVQIDITISYFDIEAASGIAAYPGLIVNRGSLASKIRKGQQVSFGATLALWPHIFVHSLLLIFLRHIVARALRLTLYFQLDKQKAFLKTGYLT